MFEGLVRQLLVGYLGRYIKDIQKEQLKIGLWNEEVLLENVELILEAFDYLQLPFALKQGRVGRLSIKIPWKKLGWDPIIIVLEDVFICACQRFDHEWSLDLVERREFASKKAKLAAAELAKLSRRVCDNQAGQSFISYITAKILDGIQVSIRNVHVIYIDKQNDSAQFVFGLRFSSLTIMTDSRVKQNSAGSSIGKLRGGKVNKTLEIMGLGFYCNMFEGTPNFSSVDNVDDSQLRCDANFDFDSYDYILEPVDVTVSLVVNKSGKFENGVPQYAVIADLTALVISLNEIQLQQILFLWDFLYLCALKEKFGRYRPWKYPLSRKPDGWQKMWWHYAQESILSDVRRKLRNTSWSNLGRRISFRRKYVSLYKTKLDFLQQEQPVNEDILLELEQMEKESEVDDILSYRSIAERQLQECLLNSACPITGTDGVDTTREKQRNDERLSSRPQGWLNWLSLGMLGAGGTTDSSQFAGVVSDEIIKDIYEATKFHPVPSSEWGTSVKNRFYLASVSFNIHQITAMLRSKRHNKKTTCVTFDGVSLQCELWEDSSVIHCLINSVEVVDPSTHKVMLLTKKLHRPRNLKNLKEHESYIPLNAVLAKAIPKESLSQHGKPSISVKVVISPTNHDIELLVKVVLQPFEVIYDSDFLVDIMDFRHALGSVQFQHERVLSSLNGFENFKGRLLAKAEYIFLNRTKVMWDISSSNAIIKIPWTNKDSELFIMVLGLGLLSFKSRFEADRFASASEEQYDYLSTNFLNSNSVEDMSLGIQLQDLYDHFEIQLTDFEVKIMVLNSPPAISVLERFDGSIFFRSCMFLDESMLKQLEVQCIVSSLGVHFSPSIFDALFGLSVFLNISQKNPKPVVRARNDMHIIGSQPNVFQFSVHVSLESVNFRVNLEDDAENSLILSFALGPINIQYAFEQFVEYHICMKILEIHTCSLRGELNNHVLFSSRNSYSGKSGHQNDEDVGLGVPSETFGERNASAEGCLLLHYQAKGVRNVCHKYTICLNNVDLHCYPRIIGLLLEFYDRISGYGISSSSTTSAKKSVWSSQELKDRKLMSGVEPQKYGFSNFYETGSNSLASIPFVQFPFITICNSGSLSSLESSLIHGIHEWRRSFHMRDRKSFKSQRFTVRKWSRLSNVSTMKSTSGIDSSSEYGSSDDDKIFVIDLNLNGIRLHFHDSSYILGTITLPDSASGLFFHAPDCWDILCSIEGLVISSSWFTPDIHEFLWGPSLTNLSTILNIRLIKERDQTLIPKIQISIGIQHVCCVLVPEFLAMVIGYFSLPDWNLNRNEQHATENYGYGNIKDKPYELIYKFEILDCTLVLPMEKSINYALQIGFQQLYCSFIPESNSTDVLKDIPHECMLPAHKVAERLHIVNVFGRGTSLSLVLLKDDGQFMLKLGQDTSFASIPLIVPLDADLWIRIPCETLCSGAQSALATCIMTRVESCQLVAEEEFFFCGLKAVMDVIIRLSSVGKESQGFTSDVLQFMQLRRSLKESDNVGLSASNDTFTEARLWVNELSVKLYRSRRTCSWPSELVAKADVQLNVSASLRNDILLCLDADVSSLVLNSCHNSVTLLQCNSGDSISSGLDIHFFISDRGENVLVLAIPCFNIWLHVSDWTEIIDLLSSYTRPSSRHSTGIKSSKGSHSGPVDPTDNLTVTVSQDAPESQNSSYFTSENNFLASVDLIVKSVNIAISIHFPLSVKEEAMDEYGDAKVQKDMPQGFETKYCKYVAIIMRSRDIELAISGGYVKFKANFEKIRGMLEMIENQRVSSLPFFQIFQVNVVAEVFEKQQKFVHVTADVRIETLDMWLAHQIFHFAHDVRFEIPGTASSQDSFHSLDFKIRLRKASLLLSDGRWSCNGPILEILVRNLFVHANQMEYTIEASVAGELLVNYNNIHKVMWEPFIEPWNFQLNMVRKHEQELLNASITTDIHLKSAAQFNLNFTEPLIEAIHRGNEMIKDALGQIGALDLPESQGFLGSQTTANVYARRYAPYILQNDTSLPLSFQVSHSLSNEEDIDILQMEIENIVQPGFSVPIYIDETPEDQIFRHRPTHSSERLNEKKSNGVAHHMISIQLDGTSRPSKPMSMDLVGLSCFEVDFSKTSDSIELDKAENASRYNRVTEEPCRADPNSGFVVPVVFEVSIQRYSKLIRLYSTVILLNATSMPLELRFDIPFGVSPKVLGPIFPGQEFPLPLHLAEAGRMRWRPVGTNYLWSEAHPLSNILSQENRLGFLRSSVCYPSHPSSDPFRCCISLQDISLSSSNGTEKGSSVHMQEAVRQSFRKRGQRFHKPEMSKKRFIHLVKLTTPLLVKNYLPVALSLTIESVGVTRSTLLSEVDIVSIFHIDSTHDLGVLFHMDDFKTVVLKFPRAEIFTEMAKLSESKFSISEILTFYPDSSNGPICVSVEKVMDASCGARELCISIPFLLYNCTGLSLSIVDDGNEKKENSCLIPSCYDLIGESPHLAGKHGLALLSFEQDSSTSPRNINGFLDVFSKAHTITLREHANLHSRRFLNSHFSSSDSSMCFLGHSDNHNLDAGEVSSNNLASKRSTTSLLNLSGKVGSGHNLIESSDSTKVKGCMYSPPSFFASEPIVRLSTHLPECVDEIIRSSMWSSPFFLAPASGSAIVIIPQNSTSGAFIISVTSTPVSGVLSGRTRAITFQPRYVISNACSKELYYKQKGTDFFYRLGVGQHSHLHWADMTRELLISIRFNEPGWQWSGSFLPDQLGDAQVKMRNYASGALNMVRVEVQNVDVSIKDEKIVGSSNGNPGTHLILLSDDSTGFMPYRIDNFSTERLRIYQQKCETFETIIHSYTSCPYAWDEPSYPHRLVVEVPGERVLGFYSLDDVKEYIPVYLPSTSEKPERRIFLSIHAEGAVKVLSIIDSSCHVLEDMKDTSFPGFKGKNKVDVTQESQVDFSERITVHMSFIGISLINSSPQELIFACAKDLKIDVLQSLDQQKLSFQILSLQIDNQLRNTPYPVILSFDHEMKNKEDKLKIKNGNVPPTASDAICQPIFYLSAAKWRNRDSSLVSFEYINLRLAPLRVELEEQMLLSLFDFFRTVTSRLQSRAPQHSNFEQQPLGPHARDYASMHISSSQLHSVRVSKFLENSGSNPSLPSVVPIGAPWQQIFLLARRQKKIYIEVFDLAPIKLVVSFSSTPWMLRNETHTAAESLRHVSSIAFQRGLMALVDVEGAPVYLRQLTLMHHMASCKSIQEILIRHYTWQILHEMYKVFGSAGVIGNPMGFARNVGLGLRDFLSVPAKGILQSPAGLVTGMVQGTMSLLGNTVYAISNATTQFSKAAQKGIVAFTFDEQAVAKMEKQQKGLSSHSKGVLNEFLEGLTGFLQSPIKGAEKHGLPGVLSGIALGTAGLVARPVASILEVTGKTAQSIRNQSSLHQPNRSRIRFPRPLAGELPLMPYSWEEAIGISMLLEADDSRLKDEIYVMCKALKQAGKFIIITERLVLIVGCPSLVGLGSPEFKVVADPEWVIEVELDLDLESVIHIDRAREVVNIVGSSTETLSRQHQVKRSSSMRMRRWSPPSLVPLFQTSMEFSSEEDAEDVLQVLWSTIEQEKERGRGLHVLHQSNLR